MKTSIIRYRVADFLKQSAPFDAISEEDLLELAATGRVSFHEAGEFVFRKNQQRKPWLWVIQQGTVEIIDEAAEGHRLHDLLGSGDVLGLGYFLRSESYFHSARTASDVILYSIDARSFAVHVAKYPRVARFLAAQFSVSERYKDVLQTAVDEKLAGTAATTRVVARCRRPIAGIPANPSARLRTGAAPARSGTRNGRHPTGCGCRGRRQWRSPRDHHTSRTA